MGWQFFFIKMNKKTWFDTHNMALRIKIDKFHSEARITENQIILTNKRTKYLYELTTFIPKSTQDCNDALYLIKAEMALNLKNKNYNIVLDTLVKIRKEYSMTTKQINLLENHDVIRDIINILCFEKIMELKKEIWFEGSWIIINYLALKNEEIDLFTIDQIINIFYNMLDSKEMSLIQQVICFFAEIKILTHFFLVHFFFRNKKHK